MVTKLQSTSGLSHIYRSIHDCDYELSCDLTFVCGDGMIESYQAFFSWLSGTLRRMFQRKMVIEDHGKRKDRVTLIVPDVEIKTIKTIITLFTLGEVPISQNTGAVRSCFDLLGIDLVTKDGRFKPWRSDLATHDSALLDEAHQNSRGGLGGQRQLQIEVLLRYPGFGVAMLVELPCCGRITGLLMILSNEICCDLLLEDVFEEGPQSLHEGFPGQHHESFG